MYKYVTIVCTALYYINQNVTLTLWTAYFLWIWIRVWYYWEIFLLYGFSPYLISFPIWFVEQMMTSSKDELKLSLQSRIIMMLHTLLSWRFVEKIMSAQDVFTLTLQLRITMTLFKLFPLTSENELLHISTATYEILNI